MEMQFRTLQSTWYKFNLTFCVKKEKPTYTRVACVALHECIDFRFSQFVTIHAKMCKVGRILISSGLLYFTYFTFRQANLFFWRRFFKEDILHCSTAVVSFSSLCVSFSWYSMNIGFRWRRTKFWISNREVLDRDKNTLAVFPLSFVTIQLG